jgi:very-short-patch-repair endonuclease
LSKEALLARRAAHQAGVFTRQDALRCGLSKDQIADRLGDGRWVRQLPSIYRFAGTPESEDAMRWAAVLWAGTGALISHLTAATMWDLDGVPHSRKVHLLVGAERRLRSRDVVVHRSTGLERERRFVDGLPVTRPELTLIHVASLVGEEVLETAFESARARRLVTTRSVTACVERVAANGRHGTAAMRALLAEIGNEQPAESVLEVKAARLLRRSALPRPLRQHAIGRQRVDFAWPEKRLVLECDGKLFHANRFQADRSKWSALAAAGWRVIVVTWDDVTRRAEHVLAQLGQALSAAA